ncbi:MAG: outer rane chaperone Skp (OmpH) [Firmicutes bacterium]|nr:outer rane chaperone Skp (OmpH) [Bacillota bacterium]
MRRSVTGFCLLMLTALVLAPGCFKQPAQETKPSVVNSFGIIDLQKATEAHPKYPEVAGLQKQLNTLVFQINQRQSSMLRDTATLASVESSAAAGLQKTLEHEFQSRMAAKQEEINTRLEKSSLQFRRALIDEMKAFEEEVDRQIEPQLINIQLKMRTLQLTQEEKTALQQNFEKLQKERTDRLRLREQQLHAKLETWLAPQRRAADQELSAFAQQLQLELAQKEAAQKDQFAARALPPFTAADGSLPELQMRADRKQQEIAGLKEEILRDVRDKTAKVAISMQLDVVLANILVNSSAIDITGNVIAELKK